VPCSTCCLCYAASNASGHRVADQAKALNAACIVDKAYQKLRATDELHHRSVVAHRAIDKLIESERAGGAAAGAPSSKRARVDAPAAAAAAAALPSQQCVSGELPVDEVIGRFLNGSEGLGPTNTQVRGMRMNLAAGMVTCRGSYLCNVGWAQVHLRCCRHSTLEPECCVQCLQYATLQPQQHGT
jgi:hypothetical protein